MSNGSGVEDAKPGRSLTYKDAGVDIGAGNEAVRRIQAIVESTHIDGVVGGIGGFAGAFAMPSGLQEPLLVSSTDGVGTKLLVAIAMDRHDTVGVDLVAMVVNDMLVTGAKSLFLLDYIGTGVLAPQKAEALVAGVANGCRQARCALIGGEMAELPGMYASGHYDLAAFGVGVVEKQRAWGPQRVRVGDRVIALHASGLHSNGYSLARRALLEPDFAGLGLDDPLPTAPEVSVGEALLTPTRIYERALAPLRALDPCPVHAAANITGGGLLENPQRGLAENQGVRLDLRAVPIPPVMQAIAAQGVSLEEMRRTFNGGVGMLLYVDREQAEPTLAAVRETGCDASLVGEVVERLGGDPVRFEA
ncbi:MAG: phosphoribosylformylglycinamidine cyclo-ligase [Myxococcales bacterium FL481]|nr:MAG: phosphoribosylformylglycinamidine cyclo-ligase [Myxococcales bacterium FL481]